MEDDVTKDIGVLIETVMVVEAEGHRLQRRARWGSSLCSQL